MAVPHHHAPSAQTVPPGASSAPVTRMLSSADARLPDVSISSLNRSERSTSPTALTHTDSSPAADP